MEKRYQVFISSTFQDLENARQEVSQALLRADCFPAGMELFPAADEEQFEFIKTIIDQSDYYILISAGRYGSIHPETGLSYTEMEYDYAVKIGKPVIRLLHKDPFEQLTGKSIEKTDEGRDKLKQFRKKLSGTRLVRYWENPSQLQTEVLFGLTSIIKTRPADGWTRNELPTAGEPQKLPSPQETEKSSPINTASSSTNGPLKETLNLISQRENKAALITFILAALVYWLLRHHYDYRIVPAIMWAFFAWVFIFAGYLTDGSHVKDRLKEQITDTLDSTDEST